MPPRDVSYFLKGQGVKFPLSSHCSQTVPVKFLLFPLITHQKPFVLIKFSNNSYQFFLVLINNPSKSFCFHQVLSVPINFFVFPTQPYINPHKAQTLALKVFFAAWKHGSWDVSMVRKTIQMWLEIIIIWETWCVRKWLWRIGTMFFFFHFLSIDILAKFDPKIAKLVEFTPKK